MSETDPTLPPPGHGRGAWTHYGMPVNSTVRLYRMLPPPPVGGEPTKSPAHLAVHLGVRAIQILIDDLGYRRDGGGRIVVDGTLDAGSARAIKWAQERLGIRADGFAGQPTLKALLAGPSLAAENTHDVPDRLVFGLMGKESGWDPGAVGYTTPDDSGLCQINLAAHPEVTLEQAYTPAWALDYTAARMRRAFKKYRQAGASVALAWDCAVAQHNSPRLADDWADSGRPPRIPERIEQIEDYVGKVREFAATAPAA